MKEIKLYSPLEFNLDDRNTLSPDEFLDAFYAIEIQKALIKAQESIGDRGLMEYFDKDKHPQIDEKINSIKLDITLVDEELGCVTIIELNEDCTLTEKELGIIKGYMEGQMSDGFGEGFEQQPITIGDNEVYVSLWRDYAWDFKYINITDKSAEISSSKPDAPMIGADGNIFSQLSIAKKVLIENHQGYDANEMISRVMNSDSYDEALRIITEYVNPVDKKEYHCNNERINKSKER